MQVPYGVRVSDPLRPRVMRGVLRRALRSVDRGPNGLGHRAAKLVLSGGRHSLDMWKATSRSSANASCPRPRAVEDPCTLVSSLHEKREVLRFSQVGDWVRIGNPKGTRR